MRPPRSADCTADCTTCGGRRRTRVRFRGSAQSCWQRAVRLRPLYLQPPRDRDGDAAHKVLDERWDPVVVLGREE
eukprot:480379-Prymnesium_polylepis.1